MENATNALILAAGVLIGIVILSFGIALYSIFGGFVADANDEIADVEIAKFNDQFLKYDKRDNLTIQDVITARNAALESNLEHNSYTNELVENNNYLVAEENTYYVDVFFKPKSSTKKRIFDADMTQLLKDYIAVNNIKCTVSISTVTRRVFKVEFEQQ